ncbi:hypothetical protein RP726_17570 [Candidatus Methylospira mobilis]|uniref:hypothetical protein n=1 Tax=Candidatus Methylospira mobilis TaxID=1808979 RepID=UPI0028EA4DC3|nr:hypothetical protein [Candidatus Methylospira mobilis]WNV04200.1 hypothetical protein RP726_17570 [Candidatus Methylospira mobilis]
MTERKYISALEVISGIADRIELQPHIQDKISSTGKISATAAADFWAEHNPKIERMRCLSIAARMLKAPLSDPKYKPPQTMEKDYMGFHSCTDNKQAMLNLLTEAQVRGNTLLNYYCDTFRNAITQGDSALKTESNPTGYDPLPLINMGFDRIELVSFLDEVGISHKLAEPKAPSIYNQRDDDCRMWLDANNPDTADMKKKEIHDDLKQRNPTLWTTGFDDWWKQQTLIEKKKSGRRKNG